MNRFVTYMREPLVTNRSIMLAGAFVGDLILYVLYRLRGVG